MLNRLTQAPLPSTRSGSEDLVGLEGQHKAGVCERGAASAFHEGLRAEGVGQGGLCPGSNEWCEVLEHPPSPQLRNPASARFSDLEIKLHTLHGPPAWGEVWALGDPRSHYGK